MANPTENKGLPIENLSQASLWIFGVLAALAIERAADLVLPKLKDVFSNAEPNLISFADSLTHNPDIVLLLIRFIVFTILVVRFYLGSYHYYTTAKSRDYLNIRDTIIGSIHYTLFLLCSLSIDQQLNQEHKSIPLFMLLLGVVLLFDWFWLIFHLLIFRRDSPSTKIISKWVLTNTLTVFAVAGVAGLSVFSDGSRHWELAGLTILFVVSIIDLDDLSRGRNVVGIILNLLRRWWSTSTE